MYTFRMIGLTDRIDLHRTDSCTGAAACALMFVYPVAEDGYGIKDGIHGAERAYVLAERPVDQDRQQNRHCQKHGFPCIQPSYGAAQ